MNGPYKQDGVDGDQDRCKRFVGLYGTAAITKGQAVVIDTTDTTNGAGFSVKKSVVDDDPLAVGVAEETTTAAGNVKIQLAGYRDDCTARTGAIAVGTMVGSAGTAGASDHGGVKQLGTVSSTVWPFALCVDAFTDDNANGIILIEDRGFYK
jgi:hypothetical protein